MDDNPKLQEFHTSLTQAGYAVPDYATFEKTLSEPTKSKEFYDALVNDKYELPDYDTFTSDLGLKKKDDSEYGLPTSKAFGDIFSKVVGDIPKLEAKTPETLLQYPHWTDVSKALGIELPKEIADSGVNPKLFGEPETIGKKPEEKKTPVIPKEITQPADKTMVKTDIREPYIFTIDDYLKKRGVVPEEVGLDPDVNTDRFIDVDERVDFDKKLEAKGLYTAPGKYRESLLMAPVKGLYTGVANMVRDIGYILNEAPQQAKKAMAETGVKIAAKIKGLDSETTKQYMEQVASAIDNGMYGNTSSTLKEGYEESAKWLEGLVKTRTPNTTWGRALENTGAFIPDLISIGLMPESKAPLLVKYGMQGMIKFPAYLGAKTYVEGAKEGKPLKEIIPQSLEAAAQGMTFNGLGVWAHEIGAISKSIGAGMWQSKATEILANSLGFGAVTKAGGGDVEQGFLEGIAFSALGAPEAIKQGMQKKAMLNWMTATNNNIRMVAAQKIDPFKLREESNKLFEKAQALPEGEQRDHLLWQKTMIDNTIDIAFTTNQILRNPDAFIKSINDNPLMSAKEKKVWTTKVNETVNMVDPRILEAQPITENIKSLEGELKYWNEKTDAEPDLKASKVEALENQIKEQKEARIDIFSKPLDKYESKPEKKSETAPKEEIINEEIKPGLSLGDKSFADKTELFKHLEEVAIDKKTGEMDKTWFDRELNTWPNMETVKAVNEWTESKKAELKAKKEAEPEKPTKGETIKVQKEFDKNGLIDEIRAYNDLSASQKKKNASQANNIRINAQRLGYDLKEDAGGIKLTQGGKVVRKTPIKVDKAKIESQKLLSEHEPKFQEYVNDVLDTNPDLYGVMISGLSNEQWAQAFRDIKEGKKTNTSAIALSELERMYKEHGGIDVWNAEGQSKVSISREDIQKEKDDLIARKRGELDKYSYQDADILLEKGLITKIEYDEITEHLKKIDQESRNAEEDFYADNVSDNKGSEEKSGGEKSTGEEIKLPPNEKPNEPDITVGKGEGDNLPGGTETDIKPIEKQGEAKPPRTTDTVKQKQIDAIDKEYDEKIADAQKELTGMTDEARQKVIDKATAEINNRNTIFGDAEAIKDGVLKPGDQGFEVSRKPIDEALRKFNERKIELTKQVDALNKERESKIGDVLKQQTLGFEEPAKTVDDFTSEIATTDLSKYSREELDNLIKQLEQADTDLIKTDAVDHGTLVRLRHLIGMVIDYRNRANTEYNNAVNDGVSPFTKEPSPPNSLNDAVSKYGWSAVKNPKGYWLLNSKGQNVVQVKINGDKYSFHDTADKKLMSGNKDITNAAERLLKEYYYAKEIAPEIPVAKAETQGIPFKDKTYQSVDEVQDAFDRGDITFEEQKPLVEQVRKFEDGLRDEAKNASDNIGGKIDKGITDFEDPIKKDINDKNSTLSIRLFPDIISKANTALYKVLLPLKVKLSEAIANQLEKGVKSQANIIRWSTKTLTNLYQGLLRTEADMFGTPGNVGKLEMMGTVKAYAPHKGLDLLRTFREVVNGDTEALRRVLDVLDPEIATEKLSYGDLSQAEKNLFFTLKEWNTWVWSTNYANGLIPTESHLKFKGDFDATGYSNYIARMYDTFEEGTILSPEIQEFISRGNSAVTSRLNTDYMKLREETNEWKKTHAIRDPAYLTAKRVMQTIQNVAVKQYMDLIIAEHPDYVRTLKKGEEVPKGYTKLGSSYSWGPFRNKAVANHIVEDFTGFHYANAITNTAYDLVKMVDRTKLNQFYKKFRTVYNPFVQTGNVTGNVFFASINGINPGTFIKGMIENRNLHEKNPALYDLLLKSGLIGDVGITGEMKPLDLLKGKPGALGKADEFATRAYVGADNLAKISAYQIFRRQGLSHQMAVRRAYDAFQNYATVGKTWDIASKIPLIGPTFVKFQADLQRILLNNILTTPLTTIGTFMMIKMFGNLASALSKETEEEQKIRETRKGVAKIPFLNIPLSFKIGKSEVNVARYLTPLYIYPQGDNEMDISELSKFMPLQFQKKEEDNLFPIPAFADATWGWLGSVLADRDFRMMSIQDPKSTRYTDPNITTSERIFNVLNFAARSQVPFYKGGQDLYKGATGQLDYYGRKRNWYQAIMNNIIKIQEFDKPELKNYVERNLNYLTSRYASLATRMGDANGNMFKAIKYAQDKGLEEDVITKLYESESKTRDKRLRKSLDEQIPVMQEIERLTDVYKKWYPRDQFIQDNFQNIESGKNQRFNVVDEVDLQKKYKDEYILLKNNSLLKKPEIPKFYRGAELTDKEKKEYSNIYWTEYIRQLDTRIGLTQEEMDEMKDRIARREKADTPEGIKVITKLDDISSMAASRARQLAERTFRYNK